jgi:hypothetical protein
LQSGAGGLLRRAFELVYQEAGRGVKVTVVGLEALRPLEVKKCIEVTAAEMLARVVGNHMVNVEVCSFDEYCARVGPRRAALEMVIGR